MRRVTARKIVSFAAAAGACVCMTGAAWAQTPAPAAQGASPRPANTSPAPRFRSDPMKPWWDTRPKVPSVLTRVSPVRIAIPSTPPKEREGAVVFASRTGWRVSGILAGSGVLALLDGPEGSYVVRPGQTLDDGFRVETIAADAVTLTKTEGRRSIVESIRLTDRTAAF